MSAPAPDAGFLVHRFFFPVSVTFGDVGMRFMFGFNITESRCNYAQRPSTPAREFIHRERETPRVHATNS